MGTGSSPGVKRPERGVDHPPLSSVEVKKKQYFWALVACSRVTFIFTFTGGRFKTNMFLYEGFIAALAATLSA
jgi:hypothetical protein